MFNEKRPVPVGTGRFNMIQSRLSLLSSDVFFLLYAC